MTAHATALDVLIARYIEANIALARTSRRHDDDDALIAAAREEQRQLVEALQGVLKDHEYPLYCIAFDKADRIRDLLAKHKEPASPRPE